MKIEIEKLVYEGNGIGRGDNGKLFFVKKTVPGDVVEAQIIKEKAKYCEASISNIITASPKRITAPCPYFNNCGGCEHQNISYEDQLVYKQDILNDIFSRHNISLKILLPITKASDSTFGYRNVMRFSTILSDGKLSLAMHDYADFNELVPINKCFLQDDEINEIAARILENINLSQQDLDSVWQFRFRKGNFTGDIMIEIMTTDSLLNSKDKIIAMVKDNYPCVKSIYHCISQKQDLRQLNRKLIYGSPIIHEKIGKFLFQISPDSFFQTNSMGVKSLYETIKKFADLEVGDRILDLHCGTGTIGIYLSTLSKTVTGVEIVQAAINDARANARINKINNCDFVCDDASTFLKKCNNVFDIIITDPPRSGLDPNIIAKLAKLKYRQLIYVSCNPFTFARDVQIFKNNGLELKKAQPIDMFPHTHHIEIVGLLKKWGAD